MEYIDYETGKEISREQYITNGLERGDLLLKEECGCVVIQDRTAGAYIVGCYKHEAAPDMYEALKEAADYMGGMAYPEDTLEKARATLAKAEGK